MEVTDKDREVSRNCRNAWDRNVDCAAEIVAAHREQAIIPLARALAAMVALAENMGMDAWDTSALSEEGLALIEEKRVLDECK